MTRLTKGAEPRRTKDCADSLICVKDSGEGGAKGGAVTGYASTFDRERDSYGDVVAPGAFAETLKRWADLNEAGKYIPLLYGHNAADPEYNIGRITEAREDERGLLVTAEFDADNPKAQYVRKLVREGRVYQFSFAYDITDCGEVELEDGSKANELRGLDLFEVSLVQIPANQHATVEDVKSAAPAAKSDADAVAAIAAAIAESTVTLKEASDAVAAAMAAAEKALDGLSADNGNPGKGKEGGDSPEEGEKGRESESAEALAAYKQAVIAAYSD